MEKNIAAEMHLATIKTQAAIIASLTARLSVIATMAENGEHGIAALAREAAGVPAETPKQKPDHTCENGWVDNPHDIEQGMVKCPECARTAAQAAPEDSPSTKQGKLLALADRIDHEQLWRRPGMERFTMTDEQRDRLDAAVNLRRYADIWSPGHWVIVPPTGGIQFGASTLEKAVEMTQRDQARHALS